MLEKDLETNLINSLKNTTGISAQYIHTWNTTIDEVLSNFESETSPTIVDVRVELRQYDTAQIPTANIPCSITAYTRTDADPTGEKSLECAEGIMNFIQAMQNSLDSAIGVFETPTFSVAGFRIDGGQVFRDAKKGLHVVEVRFTLRGTISECN